MQTVELSSQKRDLSTKGALRQLRAAGRVAAVVYGNKKDPAHASVDVKEVVKLLTAHGRNVLVNLKGDAGVETVLVQDLQRDLITRQPIHIDFRRISMTEKLEVSVPIHVKGEAPGVKLQGGILESVLHEVRIKCLPSDIPSEIEVDISGLSINAGIKVRDIRFPSGAEVVTDAERLVLHIVAPTEFKEETPAAAPAAGAAEPEVIAKGKKPEEGAEGAAAAPAAGAKGAVAPAAGGKAAPAAPAKEGAKK